MNLESTERSTLKLFTIFAIILLMVSSLYAQTVKNKTLTITGDNEVFLLKEIGGIIIESNDSIKVEMVMPADARAKEYQSVDIQAGDLIRMANAKKLTSLKMFKELYDSLEIGDELKLGIFRSKKMMIASLIKGDPEKLPGNMMMIAVPDGDDGEIETGLIDAGLLLLGTDDGYIVEDIIDNMIPEFEGEIPQKGDKILSIQKQQITTSDQITEILEKIKAGDKIELVLFREGKEISTTFIKPNKKDSMSGKKIKIKK